MIIVYILLRRRIKSKNIEELAMIGDLTESEASCLGSSTSADRLGGNQESVDEIRSHTDASARRQLFVVKKHAATRLHYDFRLGHNRRLKSWASPDGPSDRPGDGREAIEVADHRREFAFFEGVIPEGYGAGTVMLWDWGTWEPLPGYTDVDTCLRDGVLKFILHGERLKGIWGLTRVKRGDGHRKPVWRLTKEQDSFARSESARSILEEAPDSVSTGRTLEEIAESWNRGKKEHKSQGRLFDV